MMKLKPSGSEGTIIVPNKRVKLRAIEKREKIKQD